MWVQNKKQRGYDKAFRKRKDFEMKQVIITPRIKFEDRKCKKCGKQLDVGEIVMVQRNQSGGHYCMFCWKKMCM